jgi:hypothetical protein
MAKHWTETDFLNRVYAVGPEDGHLRECEQCRMRWQAWEAARERELRHCAEQEVPADLLARQREAILERVARQQHRGWIAALLPPRWNPALGLAAMALIAVLVWQSPIATRSTTDERLAETQTPAVAMQTADAQLMAEIYNTAYETEPVAIAPVRELFEERQ